MTDIADRLNDLPPRDPSKPDTEQGLFQKFVVTRTDGSSGPGGKHEGCEYFVLDIDHDPMAKWALEAYANACETTHRQLAADLRARYRLRRSAIIDGDFSSEMVGVPILRGFDNSDPLGWLQIRRDALPPTPNFCFSIGYQVDGYIDDRITGYSLKSVAIIPDEQYQRVIKREQARQESPQLYSSSEGILRRRARAFGIARDIADGFAARRGEGGQTATYRQLVNMLLSEPEVVTAIADWRQAAREAVDAVDGAPMPPSASEQERPKATLARHEQLAVRCTLSAHHEEWWRLHREFEQSQRELLQLIADGIAARRRGAGRLQSEAASEAAIDALRSAEMPQAVPGRCRDLAERLRNFTPESQMGGSWTVGMAADLLEQIADAWNRRPAAGMNLSQGKPVHASPVIVETTALWAGAQTSDLDGAVHFTREAWAKFVQCLGQEPPLEVLTSPGRSAPVDQVHQRCSARGCQEALPRRSVRAAPGRWRMTSHDLAATPPAPPAPPQPARQLHSFSSIDAEKLIAACVPGGSVCDPQAVADEIRRYLTAWQPAQPAAQGEPVTWQWRQFLGNPNVIEQFWTEWEPCTQRQYEYALATPDYEGRALCVCDVTAAPHQPAALTDEQIDGLRGLDTTSRVRFYEHDFYVLSNFSAFRLRWRGRVWDTSEAAYHSEKFPNDPDKWDALRDAPSAHEAYKMAERWRADRRPDWDEVKVGIMLDILRAKAQQHEYVRRKLLSTGNRELVEDSWRDDFWGWGPNRDGKNMLGKLWMQVRSELRGIGAQEG